jgi:hypothetical protein
MGLTWSLFEQLLAVFLLILEDTWRAKLSSKSNWLGRGCKRLFQPDDQLFCCVVPELLPDDRGEGDGAEGVGDRAQRKPACSSPSS